MRGKTRDSMYFPSREAAASMRPPQNAGEDMTDCAPNSRPMFGFNEAPAECGGRPAAPSTVTPVYPVLQ